MMAIEIKVPSVGESISEGTLSRWHKKDGEAVRAGEPVCELETEKATQEVTAPADGVLSISVAEGTTVQIGSVLGHIIPDGDSKPTKKAPDHAKPAKKAPEKDQKKAPEPTKAKVKVLMPAARQIAEDAGVDVQSISGTGREGRILKEDVLAHVAQEQPKMEPSPAPPPEVARAQGERETRERMSSIRQRIAARLIEAQSTAAILTTFNEIDMSSVMSLRAKYKETFQKKHNVGLGFMSFFVKACVEALKAFPVVNARIEGNDIVSQHFYDLGVAVSTERGLMVPVVRDSDRKSFAEIEREIAALAQKARDNKVTVNDLQGGTFTITNGGIFGSLLSTPILNPPQSAILGMHAIQKRPIAIDDQVVIRPMMYVALSYDHRLVDGREGVGFLMRVKECVENPERLLLMV
jgi:2-oxoglutarate dehydrogenase E2 component (dihydrolipoamide succinyltransferase)